MYASFIGKKLIERVGGKYKTAREFFDKVYFPLFLDHPKLLFWATNSPFVQGIRKGQRENINSKNKLEKFHYKVQKLKPDASFAIGFGAEEVDKQGKPSKTSGAITTLDLPFSPEDIYSSWIGTSLGIGIEGGLILLIDKMEILEILFEGWNSYRRLVNETPNLKGRQINTWNGQWLTFALNNKNYKNMQFSPVEKEKDEPIMPTQSWIKLLFALAKRYPKEKMIAYVYSLSKMNTTIGFIQINLPEVKYEIEMYNWLFGKIEGINAQTIEEVYNTEFTFQDACQNGVIGLYEIKPDGIDDFFNYKKKYKDNQTYIIHYNIYLSWVLAMLNDKNLLEKSEEIAKILLLYEKTAIHARKTELNEVGALLDSGGKGTFIEKLTIIASNDSANMDFYNALVTDIDKMQNEKFKYFIKVLRFKYHYLKNKK